MKHVKQLLSALLVLAVVLSLLPAGVLKASAAEAPAALDIGYPTFKNTELLDEVYDLSKLGVSYSEKDIMMAIYKQDLANGGDSFYMDRILAREGVCNGNAGSNGNADGNTFLTRGRGSGRCCRRRCRSNRRCRCRRPHGRGCGPYRRSRRHWQDPAYRSPS